MKKYSLLYFLGLCLMLFLSTSTVIKAQNSLNTVKYQITYNSANQVYTAWIIPDYKVPNANNSELNEYGGTAQFSIVVPNNFVITNVTDIKGIWTKTTDSDFRKFGPGQPGQVWTGLDPTLSYYLIGKAPSETNYGIFSVGVPVALFSFTGNSCYGVVKALPANDPFIAAADDAYSLNAGNSFYSRSGQPIGGNQRPLEQFVATTGIPANCLPPIANPDKVSTVAGIVTTLIVLSNDKANDGTQATLTNVMTPIITELPTKGKATVNLDGSIEYTPNLGSFGTDTFIYSICDKINITTCDTAKVTISITGVPQAIPDMATVVTGVSSPILILGNDKNADGTLVVDLTKITTPTITTSPTKGTVTVNADGLVNYTANAGASGTDTFIYSICDKVNTTTGFNSSEGIQDIETVYNQLNGIPTTNTTHGVAFVDGETVTPGIYSISGAVSVAGTLTLDGGGNPDALFIIKSVAGAINTGAGVSVVLTNGAKANNVFWIAGGAFGLGANTTMQGTILCHSGAVSVGAGSSFVGRLFTNAGAISLNTTVASLPNPATSPYVNYGSLKPLIMFSSNGALSNTSNSNITGDIGTGSGAITGFDSPSTLNGNIYYASSTTSSGFATGMCDTALVTITITTPQKVCLSPKAYLQGALLGVDLPNTLMRDDLRAKNLIPTTSPYLGGLTSANTTTSTVLAVTGSNAIVDWVFVELRSGTDSTLVIDSRSALIQRDGDIVDMDGTGSLLFSVANTGQYYLVVKHRNHLSIMSVKNLMSDVCKIIDFTLSLTPNFNLNSLNIINQPQITMQQGNALWAGNALPDKEEMFQGTQNDVNAIYTQVVNAGSNFFVSPSYKFKGYYAVDIDMNGEAIFQGTGNDVEFIYDNIVKNHIGNILELNYFKIKQQLP